MKVVFIRHLQTPGNEKRQYIGRTDEELSARAVAAFRQKVPQDAHQKVPQNDPQAGRMYPPVQYVVASPMRRCIGTARLIYPGQEVITEPLLRECDFGAYEGKTYEELKDEPAYIRWLASGGMGRTARRSSCMAVRSWRRSRNWQRQTVRRAARKTFTGGRWKTAAGMRGKCAGRTGRTGGR